MLSRQLGAGLGQHQRRNRGVELIVELVDGPLEPVDARQHVHAVDAETNAPVAIVDDSDRAVFDAIELVEAFQIQLRVVVGADQEGVRLPTGA